MNPLTSGTSNASSGILQSLQSNQSLTNDIQQQLSSNKKILDPAQQGVVTRLASQVTSYGAAHNNIAKAQNVLNVAATGLKSISSLLTQMQDLANKANDATMTSTDAAKLQQTFLHLLAQVDSTAKASKVDGTGLLSGAASTLAIQTGLTTADTTGISGVSSDNVALGITALGIGSPSAAAAAITALASALATVSTNQSSVAADQMSLETVDSQDASISQNLQNTIDTIQKPDAAKLQMDLQAANNQQSMNYYLINQMNQEASSVLTIFR
jgi:flagellin-like hook-associated protein FlgL